MDEELVQHVRQTMFELITDAASNERSSGQMLRRGLRGEEPIAPKLRFIVRDKAHASRRLKLRPTKADKYLDDLEHNFL